MTNSQPALNMQVEVLITFFTSDDIQRKMEQEQISPALVTDNGSN